MKTIGFKNFRKFKEFPPIGLSPITVLVGENNAGKSTVVKGLLALNDYLCSETQNISKGLDMTEIERDGLSFPFYFNTRYHAHLGTFHQSLRKGADKDTIEFSTYKEPLHITITIKAPEEDEVAYGLVSKIKLEYGDCLSVDFDLEEYLAIATFLPPPFEGYHLKNGELCVCFDKLRFTDPIVVKTKILPNLALEIMKHRRSFNDIEVLIHAVELSIDAAINPVYEELDEAMKKAGTSMTEELYKAMKKAEGVGAYVSEKEDYGEMRTEWTILRPLPPLEGIDEETKKVLLSFKANETSPFRLIPIWWSPASDSLEYIYAHEVSQTFIYSAKDVNDYLSHTIHEYASKNGQFKHPFVNKWMRLFGIGQDFNIQSIGGEAYIFTIDNFDGTQVNLSAKGMGSIQLMVLLLRIAISLPEVPPKKGRITKTFIVEEPEQNLHPKLQSKLTDLFYEVHRDYGCRFIVETHSEYLVRRSQFIVGAQYKTQEDLDRRNPFKVYYFPSDEIPYDMKYSVGGMFEKKFGDGFMNEAGKLHMAVLSNNKGKN